MSDSAPLLRTVPLQQGGARLDQFLAGQPEVQSRSQARRMIDLGLVQVPGHRVRPGLTLEGGQEVRFQLDPGAASDPLAPDLPVPDLRLLYDDPDLCAIDKPVGIAAHPPESRRAPAAHTVASWARARFGELPTVPEASRPGIVHRLDRETSGVMLVAKTQLAFDFLRAQFRDRLAQKEYRCIVFGEPRFDSDWIDRAIGTDPKRPERMAVVDDGRESSTYYEVVERFDGFAHVLCRPKTGRTHQIRVHMTSIGHSLIGDRAYRSRRRQHDRLPEGAPDPGRHCLHAQRLTVQHPQTQSPLTIEAPWPRDLELLLAWLREHRPLSR